MIRVLHILGSAHFGGIARVVHDLVNAQKDISNLQVGVLFSNARGEFLDQFIRLNVPVFSLGLNSGYDFSPIKAKRAYHIFSEYDLLHFHSFLPLLSWIAEKSRRQIIYSAHGNFGFRIKMTLSDRIKASLQKSFLNNSISYISFNSYFTKGFAKEKYAFHSVPHDVIYNGIALPRDGTCCRDNSFELPSELENKFIVGTSSRFTSVKRLDRLIRAFAEFQIGKENTYLLLVGDGILRSDLEKQVVNLGVERKTIFSGFQVNVRSWQDAMDVCVIPSRHEAFGLVALETLSLGKPTLVFKDGGGLTEIIGGVNKSDIVCDEHHLVERLDHYYFSPKDEQSINNRKEYVKQFTIDKMAASFWDVYRKTLSVL